MVAFGSRGRELTAKEQEKMLQGNTSVLYLDWGGDFMGVYIYQYSRIVYLRSVHFVVCNLFLPAKLGNLLMIHSNL